MALASAWRPSSKEESPGFSGERCRHSLGVGADMKATATGISAPSSRVPTAPIAMMWPSLATAAARAGRPYLTRMGSRRSSSCVSAFADGASRKLRSRLARIRRKDICPKNDNAASAITSTDEAARAAGRWPLRVRSGNRRVNQRCPLYPRKRTDKSATALR
jgi:hypothetical protein